MLQCQLCGNKAAFQLDKELGLHYCFSCGQSVLPENITMQIVGDPDPPFARYALIEGICKCAESFYRAALQSEQASTAREYLKKRRFSDKIAEQYGLGYAPEESQGLLSHLQKEGYAVEDIAAAGLITEVDGKWKDCLHKRLVFPLRNAAGKTVGFSGRLLTESRNAVKYMNTHTSLLYARNAILYNFDRARNAKEDFILLVEGYADVLSLVALGFDNVVASMGTSLSDFQAQLLSRHCCEAVVVYDGDEAGVKAMVKAVATLLGTGMAASGLALPGKHDPDSFVREFGRKELERRIEIARRSFTLPETEEIPLPAKTVLLDFIKRQDRKKGP
jgi:DNA primase